MFNSDATSLFSLMRDFDVILLDSEILSSLCSRDAVLRAARWVNGRLLVASATNSPKHQTSFKTFWLKNKTER